MEPNIIDFYRETPNCFHTVEKLNKEFSDLQKQSEELQKENILLKNKMKDYQNSIGLIYKLKQINKYKDILI